MILVVDNYDSFTFNLVQLLGELGAEVLVRRNDQITPEEAESLPLRGIVISPGPGVPASAGGTKLLIRRFAGRMPILGVCLGHQAIGEVFGAELVRAPAPVHGKSTSVRHDGRGVFHSLPQDVAVGRYHSLVLRRDSVPPCLQITADSPDALVMAIRHREFSVEGVQFHPESVLTAHGREMMKNFLEQER